MRTTTLIGIALLAAPLGPAFADEAPKLDNETARISYSLGHQVGSNFKRQDTELSAPAMMKGIEDGLSGAEPMMTPEEMHKTLMEFQRKMVEEQKKKAEEEASRVKEEGKKFLEENAKKEGVVTTASGLQYQIVEEGSGKSPAPTDKVTVNYRGTKVDGTEFDSSYKRGKPVTLPLHGVVKGWAEGIQLIKEGGKIKLFIPPELAYGGRGPLANQTLIFDVELISVEEPAQSKTPSTLGPKPKE